MFLILKKEEGKTKFRVTCCYESDNFSTREEYENQMRKYEEIYIMLSEIMESVDKRIEEERRNGIIQVSAEDRKNDSKKRE